VKLYAFDVDETLEVSSGPVTIQQVQELRDQGNIVGLCGNWAMVTGKFAAWQLLFSFLGPVGLTKADFLNQLAHYVPADEYVMVGNDPAVKGASEDAEAARLAGWRFIREDDFAAGAR
jgi:hypothetical protein